METRAIGTTRYAKSAQTRRAAQPTRENAQTGISATGASQEPALGASKPRLLCVTEVSTAILIVSAIGVSGILWLAILAII